MKSTISNLVTGIVVKKTITTIASSKEVSELTDKVISAGKESKTVKKAINFLGAPTKELISEGKKVASSVFLNVSIVALLFFLVNAIYIVYGTYLLIANFASLHLLLLLGLLVSGISFSLFAAYRCYYYAQFRIALRIYHLLGPFFQTLISNSILEIENIGAEKFNKEKMDKLLKKNGLGLLRSSDEKIPARIKNPIMFLLNLLPLGLIMAEIMKKTGIKGINKMEDQVMKRLDFIVNALNPHRKFTRLVGLILIGDIIVMSCLVHWM